jgi:protein TonB
MPTIKNYKADLRSKYRIYLKLSFIFSLVILIAAFKFAPRSATINLITDDPPEFIPFVDIPTTFQKPKPPEPPIRPTIIEAQNDEDIEYLILEDIDIVQDAQIGPPPDPPIILDDEPFYEWVPDMPTPIGGIQAIQKLVYYTEIARRAGIFGTVYIEAMIDEEGNVINAIVKKGIGGGLDEVALNAVNLTKFYPGKQRGKAVKVRMIIPIKFVLR